MNFRALLLILLCFSARAEDCYVPVIPDGDDKDARFCHSERAITIAIRAITDVPSHSDAPLRPVILPMVGARYQVLRNYKRRAFGGRLSLKWGANATNAYNVEAEGELVDNHMLCPTADHCILLGNTLTVGANHLEVIAEAERPAPYVRSTIARMSVDGGYLYSRDNRTFMVKVFAAIGGDWNRAVYNPHSVGVTGDVGASISFNSLNNIALYASLIEHFGMSNHSGLIHEGQFRARVRLLRDPDGNSQDDSHLFDDIHLQFQVKAYEGEMTAKRRIFDVADPIPVKVRSAMGEAGVIVEF